MSARTRNHVTVSGEGTQPMLFAHGFGCDQNVWRFIAPAFSDYRTILFDHVGAGQSDLSAYRPEKYRRLEGYAEDVLEICRELELRDVVFVGHSVSAMIGVLAAIREPERFTRLVLVSPSPCYLNDAGYPGGFAREEIDGLIDFLDSNYLGWASAMAPAIMGNPERPELGEELTQNFCRTDPEIARQFARVTFFSDNRADLPKLTIPSLIMQCREDILAPLGVGEYLERMLRGSHLQVLDATGHCPNLSAPEETIAAMRGYLEPVS